MEYDKSKADIVQAIKEASGVFVVVYGMTADDTYVVQVSKVKILDTISDVDDDIKFKFHIDDFGDVNIG